MSQDIEDRLRPWQKEALDKSIHWFSKNTGNPFLIDAAPGAGKTRCASFIARKLAKLKKIDRVIIIAPRKEIADQWSKEFKEVTGRTMIKVTQAEGEVEDLGTDLCATWQAVKGLISSFQKICQTKNTLVVCDEHHHASAIKEWGKGADKAFIDAKFILILTGTRVRSDGQATIWFNNKDAQHPKEATYTISYGEAVEKEYCRPITFHRHQGFFSVVLSEDEEFEISGEGEKSSKIPKELKNIGKALDFYTLARVPQYEEDGITPKLDSYQATMLQEGILKLNDLRERMPSAGGLVIAPNIKVAKYMAELLERLDEEKPLIVHSNMVNPGTKIKAFRETEKRWLVSVNMISEGVDISRLRILVYLPNSQTELSFKQAMGRVVRNHGPKDDTRAYVIIPRHKIFEEYAKSVENEMSAAKRKEDRKSTKRCPDCMAENTKGAKICEKCGHEFPKPIENFKICPECGAKNPKNAEHCQKCKRAFHGFKINLIDALRQGAIIRQAEFEEGEVQESEKISKEIREELRVRDDPVLNSMFSRYPEEGWVRMEEVFKRARLKAGKKKIQ